MSDGTVFNFNVKLNSFTQYKNSTSLGTVPFTLESGTQGPFTYTVTNSQINIIAKNASWTDFLVIPFSVNTQDFTQLSSSFKYSMSSTSLANNIFFGLYYLPEGKNAEDIYTTGFMQGEWLSTLPWFNGTLNYDRPTYVAPYQTSGNYYVYMGMTPEPSSLLALGTGIAGLGFLIKRKFTA